MADSEIQIKWTRHAIRRAGERFGFDSRIKIPNKRITKVAKNNPYLDSFQVRSGKVNYVCQRKRNVVTIVTVYPAKGRFRKSPANTSRQIT